MKPEEVRPKKCPNPTIIYDSGDFAIAFGNYEDIENALLMRWNGKLDDNKGYPKAYGNPMWFRIENKLVLPFLGGLMNVDNVDVKNLVDFIQKRKATKEQKNCLD